MSILSQVTQIRSQIESGDPSAAEQLLPLVYEELRKLAAARLAHEKPGQTLQATALVHEAYLRLVDVDKAQHWNSRGHFFAAAAEAMRRILVDASRAKKSQRRGGGRNRLQLLEDNLTCDPRVEDFAELDEALERLRNVDSQAEKLVELRVFAGATIDEAAQILNLSPRTVKRTWAYARAWLRREMERGDTETI